MASISRLATVEGAGGSVWTRVAPFLLLTFGLTWLLDLVILLSGGLAQSSTLTALQLQMLIPAASAILLGLLSARYGSSRVRESTGRARWFFYFYLAFAAVYVALSAAAFALPDLATTLAGVGSILALLSVLVLVVLRLARGRESFARAGLTFGKPVHWLVYGLGVVAFYFAMAGLNYVFGLGTSQDVGEMAAQSAMPLETFLVLGAVNTVVVNSLLGLVIAFGEEYGWRGFLQGELVKLGRVRGVLAVGIIWGLWHAPVIAMGYNYPGYPIGGIFLMIAFCVAFGFILGYAMLKTGSVWLAAFLHALNNQTLAFLVVVLYRPTDAVFQFSGGLYGVVLMGLVALILLRDPIWKGKGSPQSSDENAAEALSPSAVVAR